MNKQLESTIKTITERLIEKYQPEKIILFGSAARGESRRNSDIDFLIIKKSDKSRPQRAAEVYRLLRGVPRTLPFEPIVYTPEEFRERLNLGDFFI